MRTTPGPSGGTAGVPGVRADGLRGLAGRGRGYPRVRIRSGMRFRLRAATLPIRGLGNAKSTLSTPLYPTSHSIQKPGVGSFDASRRVALGLSWAKHLGNYFLNYGRYCEQQQQQQRQLEACSRFKFDRHQTAIGWIVSPRSPLVDGTFS